MIPRPVNWVHVGTSRNLLFCLFYFCLQLPPTETCLALCLPQCLQHTSSKLCMHSQQSCSAWPWNSSSGYMPITLCMGCHFLHKRITTGQYHFKMCTHYLVFHRVKRVSSDQELVIQKVLLNTASYLCLNLAEIGET